MIIKRRHKLAICLFLLWAVLLQAAGQTDFNGDGQTDFADFVAFAGAFGSRQPAYDLNGNGQVDFPDFLMFARAFGHNGTSSGSGDESADDLFLAAELLGRPTDHSVTVNVVPAADIEVYFEYGSESGVYPKQTSAVTGDTGTPVEVVIDGLQVDTRYFYRMRWRRVGESDFGAGETRSFHTQRPKGSTFTFTIQADSHLDDKSDLDLYRRTLANVRADRPDFHLDLGDTFMCDKHSEALTAERRSAGDEETVMNRYLYERQNFSLIAHSVPLFLVNGNHEGESGWQLDDTPDNLAVWATNARKRYFPNPVPDGFYSGGEEEEPFVGKRESYYAWTWGDALFVVLDPYWYTTVKPRRGGSSDNWRWTLGEPQYRWFRQALETSDARFKFVFSHHLVGGIHTGEGRGGIEMAPYYEWGGQNMDGSWGFDTHRPGWGKPIHQVMVDNGVTAFFHGHDHVFVKQELDGIVYQLLPQPSSSNFRNGPTIAKEGGYESGVILSSSGHLRVTVSGDSATVDYIRAYLPEDEGGGRKNGAAAYSYTIAPK